MPAIAIMANANDHYVVWDGVTEVPYIEPDGHDCMVTHDLELISVRDIRNEVISQGKEPILLFACEPGGKCLEAEFDGRPNGVFTYFCVRYFIPQTTLRKLVIDINNSVWGAGFYQKAEVVCRSNLLDCTLESLPEAANCATVLLQFDMCRASSSGEDEVNNG